MIEQLLHSGLNDLYQGFSEKHELFENIRDHFPNNKKLCDLITSIMNILNPNINSTNGKINYNGNLFETEAANSQDNITTKQINLIVNY